jgi:hypothetical protein
MSKIMELEFIKRVARISEHLMLLKKELERYYKEDYLHDTKDKTPWISVKIGNHPTYLSDFIVRMHDDKLRDMIVKLAMQQIKMTIKKLETELTELLKEKS